MKTLIYQTMYSSKWHLTVNADPTRSGPCRFNASSIPQLLQPQSSKRHIHHPTQALKEKTNTTKVWGSSLVLLWGATHPFGLPRRMWSTCLLWIHWPSQHTKARGVLPLLDRPGFLSSKTGTDDIFNFIYIIMYIYIYRNRSILWWCQDDVKLLQCVSS